MPEPPEIELIRKRMDNTHRPSSNCYMFRLQIVNATRIRLGLPRAMDQWQARSECHILEPFGSHFGSILGLRNHFGSILGPTWGSRSTSGQLTPFWGPILEPFWDHFWVQFGPKKQPKNMSKFKTLSDTILGPCFAKSLKTIGV